MGKRSDIPCGWVQWAASIVFLLFFAAVAYFGYTMKHETSSTYIAFLTLAVTILLAGGALIAWIGVWLSLRMQEVADKTRNQLQQIKDEAEDIIDNLNLQRRHYNLISTAYGTFRPTGLNLAKAIRNLREQVKNPEMQKFANLLAREIEKNTIIGAQLLRLFLSADVKEIMAAAMALSQIGGSDVRRMIQRRLDMEKQKAAPDNDLIEFLGKIMGMLEIN